MGSWIWMDFRVKNALFLSKILWLYTLFKESAQLSSDSQRRPPLLTKQKYHSGSLLVHIVKVLHFLGLENILASIWSALVIIWVELNNFQISETLIIVTWFWFLCIWPYSLSLCLFLPKFFLLSVHRHSCLLRQECSLDFLFLLCIIWW